MPKKFLQRRNSAAVWSSINPVLDDGEIGVDTTNKMFKIGDGVKHWNDLNLSYIPNAQLQAVGDLIVGTGPGTTQRLGRGTTGQTLSIDSGGNLVWANQPDTSAYQQTGGAAVLYETKAGMATAHTGRISSAAMAATYETLAHSSSLHNQFETFVHSAATYAKRVDADAAYAKAWASAIQPTTLTVINSTVPQYSQFGKLLLAANSTYIFEMFVSYIATVAGKMNLALAAPPSSTGTAGVHGPVAAMVAGDQYGTSHLEAIPLSGTPAIVAMGGAGATSPLFATVKGVVHTGATSSYLGYGIAQTTATADTGAQALFPSYIRALKVS